MRICHTVASLRADHGGPSRSVVLTGESLAERGHDVEIVTRRGRPDEPAPIQPRTAAVQVRFAAAGTGRQRWAPFAHMVAERLRQGDVNIVHDHGVWLPTNHAVAVAARAASVPRVVSPRGMLSSWALAQRRWRKRAAWALYQHRDLATAQALHATSEDELAEFRRAGLRQPVAVVPNGVVIPALADRTPRTAGDRSALFLSRVHPKKGLLNLVTAWSRIRPSGWRLTIAGPDDAGHRAEVERRIGELDLEGMVDFIGPVADAEKWDVYRAADLFVLPTFSENFGLVVAEALAVGVPVITTTGTPWRGLEIHRCGWWIEVGVDPLAQALQCATAVSDSERIAMGARGRSYVEREFSWARAAGDLHELYTWLATGGTRPSTVSVD